MMYIYESHMDGLYVSDDYLSYDERYCETCGDCDSLLGEAETRKEAWDILKRETNIDGSGGYDYEYVQELLNNWEKKL